MHTRRAAFVRVGAAVLALLLVASVLRAGAPQLVIMRAGADQPPDLAAGRILIQGYNFVSGRETNVAVTLAGEALAIIGAPTATEIVAELPAGYPPGTYLLTVSRGTGSVMNDSFNLTIGAVGPQGPPGQDGADGAPGLNGLSVTAVPLPAGDPNCPNGGSRLTSADGVTYACHGAPGPPGPGLATGSINGRLVACDPRDFSGTPVFVPGRSFGSITPASGQFRIDFVPPGSYDLAYLDGGHYSVLKEGVAVAERQDTSVGSLQTTDLNTTSNCGTCGNTCSFPNSTATCQNGTCQFGACHAGYGNCDSNVVDGCERNLATDVEHCGECGHRCSFPYAAPSCRDGTCQLAACHSGFADCNSNAADGCEVYVLGDASNCGACGHRCSLPHAIASCGPVGGVATCVVAACSGYGFANCNHVDADGCEVYLLSDPHNCGVCGQDCGPGGVCTHGSCSGAGD